MSKLKSVFKFAGNIPGFHTSKKLIVFTSDDWGGVRLLSIGAKKALSEAGFDIAGNRFDRYDTLESNTDIEHLFDVLLKHRDSVGNYPVIAAVANVANPDFEKIKNNHFSEYYYETFDKTLNRYPDHEKVLTLYRKGIELNIFRPEFHGREHLHTNRWLCELQSGNKMVSKAFEYEFFHIGGKYLNNHAAERGLGAAYDIDNVNDVLDQMKIVKDGADIFKNIFGYSSVYFTPPAQYYHKSLEESMVDAGFKMIDVPGLRKMPLGSNRYATRFHYLGQKNRDNGLRYLTRNAVFEPNMSENSDGVQACLKSIEAAFKYNRPAIISNHRAAFVGGIDIANRDKGLKSLDLLLSEIIKRWPDVEFISAASLYELMINKSC
ncbi:MAG: hypothetical protein PHH37_13245 [Paludibacter sp.]|nr:hypothetical protein [Paludibacter sp.]